MSKPVALLDPQWRRLDELFAQTDLDELGQLCDLVWAKQEPMPESLRMEALTNATFYLSSLPIVDAAQLEKATKLRAVIELYGAFPDTIDYPACFARGVDVLATGPGMRGSVAEMAVAMALSGARGLVQEHELFRVGKEHWLNDNPQTDFSLYGQSIGFVGFGSIAKECCRLLAPFEPAVSVYDPWLDAKVADDFGTKMVSLEELARTSRCFFVTAAPTKTNEGVVSKAIIDALPHAALLVLVSRAHLIDFDALIAAAGEGRIRAAIDVFPLEPLAENHPLRSMQNVILSPHRAAAVSGGRQLMGRLVLEDIKLMIAGQEPANLQRARPEYVGDLAGVQHSKKLEDMADERE